MNYQNYLVIVKLAMHILEVIKNIENDNFQDIDLGDGSTIEHCKKTLKLAIKLDIVTEQFRVNFIKRLRNYSFLSNKMHFITELEYNGIKYFMLSELGNHIKVVKLNDEHYRIYYYRQNSTSYYYRDGMWHHSNEHIDNTIKSILNKYRKIFLFVQLLPHVIFYINQFDLLDDIKYYIKGFLLLDKDIKFA